MRPYYLIDVHSIASTRNDFNENDAANHKYKLAYFKRVQNTGKFSEDSLFGRDVGVTVAYRLNDLRCPLISQCRRFDSTGPGL